MRLSLPVFAVAVFAGSMVNADDKLDESAAIKKIELLGGTVTRDQSLPGSPVIGVTLVGSKRFNDKYVWLLKSIPNLSSLDLTKTEITDDGLKHLKDLKHLTRIRLSGTKLTDAGMQGLAELSGLKILDLSDTKITDVGIKQINTLKELRTLNLSGSMITDECLKDLKELENLKCLTVAGSTVISEQNQNDLRQAVPNLLILREYRKVVFDRAGIAAVRPK